MGWVHRSPQGYHSGTFLLGPQIISLLALLLNSICESAQFGAGVLFGITCFGQQLTGVVSGEDFFGRCKGLSRRSLSNVALLHETSASRELLHRWLYSLT